MMTGHRKRYMHGLRTRGSGKLTGTCPGSAMDCMLAAPLTAADHPLKAVAVLSEIVQEPTASSQILKLCIVREGKLCDSAR